jgi:tetratricopeptide (TPR) repeat protein
MMALMHPPGVTGQRRLVLGIVTVCLSLAIAAAYPRSAVAQPREYVAKLVSVQGTVEAQKAGGTQWQPVKLNDTFSPGDRIRVLDKSRADIAMLDQSVLRLNANTTITIQAPKEERTGVVDLVRGAAHFFSRGPRSLDVQTPYTVAGVRGTEFLITVEADKTLLTVFEGTVVAENPVGSLTLASGQSAVAEAGKAPVPRVVARPRDAVQWALYYPPVVWFRPDEFPAGPGWQGMVRQSIEFYLKGDLQKAFDSIANAPPNITDPRFFAYRASLLLAVGRVDEAGTDIQRALALNPNDSNALALQTIIAIVQNEKDKALEVAQKAVQANPNSATAQIALSYAQQARFDLDGARASLEQAVKLEPQNALAWARLAELWSSSGELRKALDAAQKAVALEPNLSRTQTVLGFAYLTQVKTKRAKEAFEKAIALDQADPLPRLGLGLAKIRDGDLNEGSRDLEIAASLDPNNALVRSYLGKAYFEEKRTTLDEREYNVAKELDPKDPTPYFYDAISKQTTNRPVEALQELQKAIELNDNRAVYRSRLLLDSDLAARSASLARIYGDLGFQQLALVEGWKSANTDPSNFSAHRFLADSYAALPRHEIARVSELLQSQMLQPQNTTPIQPRLAESNLFLISAGGPGALSFNEFNPIFNRDGVTVQASGLVGERETFGGEGVISGIYKKLSFSGGYTYFETDGWRQNAGQKDNMADGFVQYELTPQTSVQAEFRHRRLENGDLQLQFFPEDVLSNFRQKAETYVGRAGVRHAFSPGSIVLGSFIYQHRDDSSHDENEPSIPFVTSLDSRAKGQEGVSGELQHLFRSKYVNVTSGGGYFNLNRKQDTDFVFDFGFGPTPLPTITTELDAWHANVYLYSYINFPRSVTWTLGGSGDFFDTKNPGSLDTNQFNPKFGVTWEPISGTTLRGAVFRALKRTLITDQTLEPTQVAGFNQFYDDQESTRSWRYGAAIDQKFLQTLYGGVEFAKRDLEVPTLVVDATTGLSEVQRFDWTEYLGRAYLFWTPHPWLALSAEYLYERFKESEIFNFGFTRVTTQRVPLGMRFFHPSGLSFMLKATFFYQYGYFIPRGSGCCTSGDDNFWVFDSAISYRLPKRYGIITVGATNLFDEHFNYQETDLSNPTVQPRRVIFARLTLAFP